jgi:hypothetical protein
MDQVVARNLQVEFERASENLRNYPVIREPFEHFFVQELFSSEFYQELITNLPDDSAYHWTDTKRVGEKERGAFTFNNSCLAKLSPTKSEFWRKVGEWMYSPAFCETLMNKFRDEIKERFRGESSGAQLLVELKLLRDKVNYSLRPHTDKRSRVLTMMLYLPKNDKQAHQGTAIYKPKMVGLRCDGSNRHEFEDFELVGKAPFLPNAGFCFLKSDRSFHGVEMAKESGGQRNALCFTLHCRKESPKRWIERLVASVRGTEEFRPIKTSYR